MTEGLIKIQIQDDGYPPPKTSPVTTAAPVDAARPEPVTTARPDTLVAQTAANFATTTTKLTGEAAELATSLSGLAEQAAASGRTLADLTREVERTLNGFGSQVREQAVTAFGGDAGGSAADLAKLLLTAPPKVEPVRPPAPAPVTAEVRAPAPQAAVPTPVTTARPTPAGGDDSPDWYPRFRELQNRFDLLREEGKTLRAAELAELEQLRTKLNEFASRPAGVPQIPVPPAAGPQVATAAAAVPRPEPAPVPAVNVTIPAAAVAAAVPVAPQIPRPAAGTAAPTPTPTPAPAAATTAAGPRTIAERGAGLVDAAGERLTGVVTDLAGPLGITKEAAKSLTTGLNALGATAQTSGRALQQIARNDVLGAVTTAAEGTAAALDKIPVVGETAAAGIRAVTTSANAFRETVDTVVARGRELSRYDASLAAANANADVRRILADIQEADRTGEATARVTDNQSKADTNLRELILPFKDLFTSVLSVLTEIGKVVTDLLKIGVLPILEVVTWIGKTLLTPVKEAVQFISELIEWIADNLPGLPGRKKPKAGELNSLLTALFDSANVGPGGRQVNAPAPAAGPPPLAPMFASV